MASANPASLADRFLETLRSTLATEKIGLYIGVPDELRKLEDTISATIHVLDDAAAKSCVDDGIRCWVERVQDVLHEADDVVDELRAKFFLNDLVLKRRRDRVFTKVCKISSPRTLNHHVFGQKLGRIREKTDEILQQRDVFLLRRSEHGLLSAVGSKIIGREEDLEAIVKVLVGIYPVPEDRNVSVTSVVGRRGIGKTVLAHLAFGHERVVNHFGSMRIWLKVSGAFDAKQIARSIFRSVTGRRAQEDMEIEQMLEEAIAGRKYLLVLDDVQSIDHEEWLDFKRLLVNGAEGSRVLLTTRRREVADLADTTPTHLLHPLSEEDSWSLFKSVAFLEEVPQPALEEIGKEILQYCSGVPVIIRKVGNILRGFGTENIDKWEDFCEDFLSPAYLDQRSIDHDDDVLQTLKLSIDRLQSHLKNCFAYCSLFPKGHEIDVQTLIKLWEAQGFIQDFSGPSQNPEGVGYGQHFMPLLDEDFFEIVENDIWGKATKCKMPFMVHDLATALAGKECIKLDREFNVDDVPHHVSFDVALSSLRQIPTVFHAGAARIRSILFSCQSSIEGSSSKEICDAIISNMKFLRTLDLHNSQIETVPDHIGELKHLRYLDLSRNVKIKVLPQSITRLLNLQTLKLSLCLALKELPRDIKNLINLRHLEIDGCINLTHMPRGLGQLTQLQTLSQFVLSKDPLPLPQHHVGQLKELSSLNNLRGELQIKNLRDDMDVVGARLEEKQFLQSLALDWEIGTMEFKGHEALVTRLKPHINLGRLTLSGYRGDTVPDMPLSLNKLVKLVLRRCPNCKRLPPLHHSSSLKVLVLEDMNKLEYVSEKAKNDSSSSPALFFPSLLVLRLIELPRLRSWWRGVKSNENHMFPRLSELFIYDCPELVSLPHFPTLEEGLVLDSCSLQPFQETLTMTIRDLPLQTRTTADEASSSTSVNPRPASFLTPLSKLKKLFIVGVKEFNNNTADGIMWKNLASLQYLRLDSLPSLESLPYGLLCLTSLREFHIWRCSFTELPERILDLKRLQKLSIWVCPDLKALPRYMRNLKSLRMLEIVDCPLLFHRCQQDVGADWDKIWHIPDLRIRLSSRK